MKKVLFIFLVSLLSVSLQAQIIRGNPFTRAVISEESSPAEVDSANWDSDYKAVYYAMADRPGIDTADLQNTLLEGLKTSGLWWRADLIYVMAQKTATGARLNWKDPDGSFNATISGTPTFTQYQGYTGSATAFLTTGWNPSTDAVHFQQDSCGLMVYVRSEISTMTAAIGCSDATNAIVLFPRGGSTMYADLNQAKDSYSTVANTSSLGLITATRTALNATHLYRNSDLLADDSEVSASPLVDYDLAIFRRANGVLGSTYGYSGQISFVAVVSGITTTIVQNSNTVIETYHDSIGIGVE